MKLHAELAIAATVALAVATTGCGAEPPHDPTLVSTGTVLALDLARQDDLVSAAQLKILERAIAEGREVSQEEYDSAYASSVECAEDAGVDVESVDRFFSDGYYTSSMGYRSDSPDGLVEGQLIFDCEAKHVTYLGVALAYSADSEQWRDEVRSEYTDAMRACLNENGYPVASDATWDEIEQVDLEFLNANGGQGCTQITGLEAALESPR